MDPDNTPGLKPPAGVVPDFIDPPSQKNITIAVMVVYLVLTTPLVCIRMYTRHFIKGPLKWDDWTMLLGWIGLVGLAAISFISLGLGAGRDEWNVPLSHVKAYSQIWNDTQIVARLSILFVKLSILLLFLRVFNPPGTPRNKLYWWTVATAWFNVLYAVALVLVVLFQCVGKTVPSSQCIDDFLLLVLSSTINVISDIVMLIIPIGGIWGLHMKWRQKLGITLIFAVGSIAVGASIVRLGWQTAMANSDNQTVVLNDVLLMAVAEQVAGIIVGCMPVMPSFFRYFFGSAQKASTSQPTHENRKLRYALFSIGGGHSDSRRKAKTRDPYDLTTNNTTTYEQLDEAESGYELNHTTVIGAASPVHVSLDRPEEAYGMNKNTAIVSRSFHVESHPRK